MTYRSRSRSPDLISVPIPRPNILGSACGIDVHPSFKYAMKSLCVNYEQDQILSWTNIMSLMWKKVYNLISVGLLSMNLNLPMRMWWSSGQDKLPLGPVDSNFKMWMRPHIFNRKNLTYQWKQCFWAPINLIAMNLEAIIHIHIHVLYFLKNRPTL